MSVVKRGVARIMFLYRLPLVETLHVVVVQRRQKNAQNSVMHAFFGILRRRRRQKFSCNQKYRRYLSFLFSLRLHRVVKMVAEMWPAPKRGKMRHAMTGSIFRLV